MELIERANGVELPDYAGVLDSGTPARRSPRRPGRRTRASGRCTGGRG
ncbi:hypothetical protein H7X46_17360 [Pseudonocardia sp. C8]|nr:hypothetical protein [Pseudonocardia sp. C8]MBC3192835.1 hypothetical protein [Pseudonocardia sp. C8]